MRDVLGAAAEATIVVGAAAALIFLPPIPREETRYADAMVEAPAPPENPVLPAEGPVVAVAGPDGPEADQLVVSPDEGERAVEELAVRDSGPLEVEEPRQVARGPGPPSAHSDWRRLTRRAYAREAETVARVEKWRPAVLAALEAKGIPQELDRALAVMACESGGLTRTATGQGLYQFIRATWNLTAQRHHNRTDPAASIAAMAERVVANGWRDWAGGRTADGSLWGSGPRGFHCWVW